jgi:lipopolysaccharide export system protein LptA
MRKMAFLAAMWLLAFSVCLGAAEPVKITGRSIWGDTKKKHTYIDGAVKIVQGKTVINTENAVIDLDRKSVTLTKGVILRQSEIAIQGKTLKYDLRQKVGDFDGGVQLERYRVEAETGQKSKEPFALTCEQLHLEVDDKNFLAAGNVRFTHDDFNGSAASIEYNDQRQEMLFSGQALLKRPQKTDSDGKTKDPFELSSSRILLNIDQKNFEASEDAVFRHEEFNGSADRMQYDDQLQQLTFDGHAVLNRPKQTAKNGKAKEPFSLNCKQLQFRVETRDFTASGEVALEHSDFKGTADRVEYLDQLQELMFTGNARLKRPEGEEIRGERIKILLNEKSFTVVKGVTLSFEVSEDDSPAPKRPKGKPGKR